MLMAYSDYECNDNLDVLLQHLLQLPEEQRPHNYELCLAKSQENSHRTDSAILHYRNYYNNASGLSGRYEASAGLQRCYMQQGDYRQAAQWGNCLYETNDSIIAQRAFEETQRAQDAYTYYRDKEEELAILRQSEAIARRSQLIIFSAVTAGLVLLSIILGGMVFYSKRKNRYEEEIHGKDKELQTAEEEIHEHSEKLRQKDKTNKMLTQIALLDNAKDNAESVIDYFSLVAVGQAEMREDAWRKLMSAVETLYPGFHGAVQERLKGQLREPLLRTMCLMKIGMKPMQIAQVMNTKKQTVWNRVKRAETTCGDLLNAVSYTQKSPVPRK